MAKIAFVQGNYQRAYRYSEESLRLFEASDMPLHLPKVLTLHALISLALGDKTTTATDLLNKAYIRSEEIQDLEDKAAVLHCQGVLALSQKEQAKAYALFEDSMEILLPMNIQKAGLNSWVLPANLEGLGIVAFEQGNLTHCVSLFSLADVTRQTMTYDIFFKPCYFLYHHLMKEIKQALGEEKFATAWTIGQEMTLQQALDLITQETHDIYSDFPKKTPLKPFSSMEQLVPTEELTRREVEVLRLIAEGLSNSSIAEQLVVSPHTVNRHTQSIYQKLGVKSRSAATRYAFEHDLH